MSYETHEDIIGGLMDGEDGMLDAVLALPDDEYQAFLEHLEGAVGDDSV